MDRRNQQTLEAIYAEPARSDIEWEAIEDLLIGVGCRVAREATDHVGFERNGLIGSFQRPESLTPSLIVEAVREYLTKLGVTP